jgi:translocator protein
MRDFDGFGASGMPAVAGRPCVYIVRRRRNTSEMSRGHTPGASGRAGWAGRWPALLLWLLLVAAVGALGSAVTLPKIPGWYASLAKPWFTPPNAVFGPVWTVLYIAMAVAAWRVGAAADARLRRCATGLFAVQLAFNALWSQAFFGLESPPLGLATIVVLLAVLAATTAAFWRLDRLAGLLLAPYLVWVGYAAALNVAIVALN